MNKKLIAVAVAGVFAAPAAFAQSSVTISGALVMSVNQLKYTSPSTTRKTTSEGILNDESSSIIFNVREDLGGGMTALVLADFKINPDSGAVNLGGASWIGLSTKDAGRFTMGRHNFHFFKTPWDGYRLSAPLRIHPMVIVDYAGAGGVAIGVSRTPNSLQWSSPKWGGFAMDVGYSFNAGVPGAGGTGGSTTTPSTGEGDTPVANTVSRKGQVWTFNPTFSDKNWSVGYSYWRGKIDAATGALNNADQRSDHLYGHYAFPGTGFKLGAQWNKARLNTAVTGVTVSERTAWSIPVLYTTGQHNFVAHYSRAHDDKATPLAQDGARMWAATYAYALSKRTMVSINYGQIKNEAAGAYTLFAIPVVAGEDPSLISFGMRHNF